MPKRKEKENGYRADERGEAAPVRIAEMQRPTDMDVELEEEQADHLMMADERSEDDNESSEKSEQLLTRLGELANGRLPNMITFILHRMNIDLPRVYSKNKLHTKCRVCDERESR